MAYTINTLQQRSQALAQETAPGAITAEILGTLMADTQQYIAQMEQNLDGKIIPARIRSNGSTFYSTESIVSENAFKLLFRYLEVLLSRIGSSIMRGEITPEPLKVGDKSQCKYCDYRAICRISPQAPEKEGFKCNNSEALTKIEEEMESLNGN